ncbi:MAG: hypothetical protein LBU29_04320 [Endomicrobium sp.]|nr:hypothetical protein [Endomicrobium sp.]
MISLVLMVWLGWVVGFFQAFFAVLAGFMAVFAATKYPYQEGLNFYLVFVITGLFVSMLGRVALKLVGLLCLSILDRIGGVILSTCVWLIVSVSVVVPTIIRKM